MADTIKMNAEKTCKQCVHDNDTYYCGSFCIYGDCFEPIESTLSELKSEK